MNWNEWDVWDEWIGRILQQMFFMRWQNRLTSTLNIEYPIVQAPMLGITTPEMVAAISNAGGLGSLPVGGLSPETTLSLIKAVKALTSRPFAVNLFTFPHPSPASGPMLDNMRQFLDVLAEKYEVPFSVPPMESVRFYSYKEQIGILVQEKVPVVSFTFGIPDDESIMTLKNAACRLIGTATCVEEALLLENKFVDVITAQGFEAGGHRGSFITDNDPPLVGTFALVPQVADAVQLPVLAAGAIADGRGIMAALLLGAMGAQIGSAFLACHESQAGNAHKHILQNASAIDTTLTRSYTGRWARGINNAFMKAVKQSGLEIPAYPFQLQLTMPFRSHAQKMEMTDLLVMWAGQAASKAVRKSAAEIFQSLVQQTEKVAQKSSMTGELNR